MAGLLNTNGRAVAHEYVTPLESSTHVLVVEEEQDERYALRALLVSPCVVSPPRADP